MKSKMSKILGIGLSTGLVFGLIGALFAAPVAADEMKWSIVNTPSWEDYEILPGADIYDYTVWGNAVGFWDYGYGDIQAAIFAPYGSEDLAWYSSPARDRGRDRVSSLARMCELDGSEGAGLPSG